MISVYHPLRKYDEPLSENMFYSIGIMHENLLLYDMETNARHDHQGTTI